jgi:hypothetical protein
MAYKTFTNGDVLNASEINDNLMNQSVMVFFDASSRTAAIPAPVEGMVTYLEFDNTYYGYNGGSWLPIVDISNEWKTWAPVLSGGFANGNGVWNARFTRIGKTCHLRASFTAGTTTTYGSTLRISTPVSADPFDAILATGYFEKGTTRHPLICVDATSSYFSIQVQNAASTYVTNTTLSATIPFTWAAGDKINFAATYMVS